MVPEQPRSIAIAISKWQFQLFPFFRYGSRTAARVKRRLVPELSSTVCILVNKEVLHLVALVDPCPPPPLPVKVTTTYGKWQIYLYRQKIVPLWWRIQNFPAEGMIEYSLTHALYPNPLFTLIQ